MIRVGVIGYGYWGPNLVRNFAEAPGCAVTAIADQQQARLDIAARRHPGVRTSRDARELIAAADVDAVVVATPVSTHFPLAAAALAAGKHVLVEKPLTAASDDALRLIEDAAARRLVLMVDHTFAYTPAVIRMRDLVRAGEIGEVYYYDSVRINLGLFQHDVNVLWDLAVHDLSIMDFVLPDQPVAVSATGLAHLAGSPENIAYLTIFFATSLIAHVHVNWLAPVKVRRTLLGGDRKMIVYDDLEASEKIKVYDRGVSRTPDPQRELQMRIGYRTGDMWAPHLPVAEALQTEARHFVDCVTAGTTPLTDGHAGLRVVRLLEAATTSMAERGRPVSIPQEMRA